MAFGALSPIINLNFSANAIHVGDFTGFVFFSSKQTLCLKWVRSQSEIITSDPFFPLSTFKRLEPKLPEKPSSSWLINTIKKYKRKGIELDSISPIFFCFNIFWVHWIITNEKMVGT